ncbi:hypothetical protein HDU76_005069 [Blyttiomyces sp. JEL0837]|nr:hypothetical protein HDU76_005069 [Blyttiomyces sp. JEL0837]
MESPTVPTQSTDPATLEHQEILKRAEFQRQVQEQYLEQSHIHARHHVNRGRVSRGSSYIRGGGGVRGGHGGHAGGGGGGNYNWGVNGHQVRSGLQQVVPRFSYDPAHVGVALRADSDVTMTMEMGQDVVMDSAVSESTGEVNLTKDTREHELLDPRLVVETTSTPRVGGGIARPPGLPDREVDVGGENGETGTERMDQSNMSPGVAGPRGLPFSPEDANKDPDRGATERFILELRPLNIPPEMKEKTTRKMGYLRMAFERIDMANEVLREYGVNGEADNIKKLSSWKSVMKHIYRDHAQNIDYFISRDLDRIAADLSVTFAYATALIWNSNLVFRASDLNHVGVIGPDGVEGPVDPCVLQDVVARIIKLWMAAVQLEEGERRLLEVLRPFYINIDSLIRHLLWYGGIEELTNVSSLNILQITLQVQYEGLDRGMYYMKSNAPHLQPESLTRFFIYGHECFEKNKMAGVVYPDFVWKRVQEGDRDDSGNV